MRVAPRIAAWLVARPQQAVLGLSLTLLMPFAQVLTGAVMILLVLHQGFRVSVLQALAAAALVAILAAVTGAGVATIMMSAVIFWLPAVLVAMLLRNNRSLTLAFQFTAIIALLVAIGMYVVVPDQIQFWKESLVQMAAVMRESGFAEWADLILAQQDEIAPQMTVFFVISSWSLVALVLALGYGLFQALPGNAGRFGRFCDLDFGRVLATVMAVASLLALASGADWAQGVAFIAFIVFWLQGLALVHWLHAEGPLATPLLLMVYAVLLLPFLNALLVMGLALAGYTDAWFGFRARGTKGKLQ